MIVFTFAYAESELDTLIQEVYSGNIEKATSSIGRLKKEFPDNPALLFLEAMIDNNPEESIRKFKKLYDYYRDSEYADDAIMKISEYYYAKGSYVESSNWLKKINLYYSDSEHINRSLNLYIRTLILSGKQDTAQQYLEVFKRKYKDVSFDGYIEDTLGEDPILTEEEGKNIINKIVNDLKNSISLKKEKDKKKNHFSIQIGAYSDKKNAEVVRDELIEWKFNSRIDIIYLSTKNKNLYAVRAGYFRSKESAKITKKKIELRTGYNTIVVDINEY